jgi:hypothetical protein
VKNQNNKGLLLDTYLFGYSKPSFVAKGLYAGLKSRDGLPTPLPLSLQSGDEYVNAGFLDALPCTFMRELEINDVSLHVQHLGPIKVSLYLLLKTGKIFHCGDHILEDDADSMVALPTPTLEDPNGRLVFFRIQPYSNKAILVNWYFTTPSQQWLSDIKPLLLISRSLGESPALVKRYLGIHKEHQHLRSHHPNLFFIPLPRLTIYESDSDAYKDSQKLLADSSDYPISLRLNEYNLGGGGNMCLAVHEEVIKRQSVNQFGMLDSDTILPFRTLYFTSLHAARLAYKKCSCVRVPIILYTSEASQVLECGALFGRGNWGIISNTPTQPCIQLLHHRQQLSDSRTQAEIAGLSYTDYPPFIFSIFSGQQHQLASHFLPAPFFLRGDDIEMGLHLRKANIPCEVDGSLLVFQEPRHSLWHEWMAVLHGICVVLAAAAAEDRCSGGFPELQVYFEARSLAHSRIHDLNGLHTYERVLDRLIDLQRWSEDEIVVRFHDPKAYLAERQLNKAFTVANLCMLKSIVSKASLPADQFIQLPFIYFESEYESAMGNDASLPQHIGLINNSLSSAAILNPLSIDPSEVQEIRKRINRKAKQLFITNSANLARRCLILTDRKRIIKEYLKLYPVKH